MREKIRKLEITKFAKDCAFAHKSAVMFIGTSQEIANSKIGKLLKEENDDFLIEVSKRFAKFAKENINFSLEDCAIDDAVAIINNIIDCCEENNWFNE